VNRGMCKDELPIEFWPEIKDIIKDYFLGKWVFARQGSIKAKFYRRMVK
jgi:hypothetical protein